MYININQDKECSKCGKVNFTETVYRDNESYIRCRKCGHEKLLWTQSTSGSINSQPTVYNCPPLPHKETF